MEPSTSTTLENSRKRKLFDPDTNKEISDTKRAKYDLQPVIKTQIINFIIVSFIALHVAILKSLNDFHNISVGCQVMNILYTAHSVLRQSAQKNNKGGLATKVRNGTPKISFDGKEHSISYSALITLVENCAKYCGLAYTYDETPRQQQSEDVEMPQQESSSKKPDFEVPSTLLDGSDWFGIAGPLFNFMTGFHLRWRELRLGHDEIPYQKKNGETSCYPISSFGLKRSHGLLLEGCRFPPERRSSMIQSLGPMTLLTSYLMAKAGFDNKIKAALLDSIPILRDFPNILDTIKGKKIGELRNIIGLIAEISILTTTRQRNRAFPPPTVFVSILANSTDFSLAAFLTSSGPLSQPPIKDSKNRRTILRSHITFSGIAQAVLNNIAAENSWKICGDFSDVEFQQLIFHSWWGTFKEDFGILRSITNHANWFKRDQFGRKFRASTSKKVMELKSLVVMKYYSKLSCAIQTNYAGTGLRQVASIPCFSGRRTRLFGGSYFKYITEQTSIAGSATTLQGIENELTIVFGKMIERLKREDGTMEAGTTEWFAVDINSSDAILMDANKMIPAVTADIKESMTYFLG
uniref:Nucleocapsid n=1 Tax=Lestrade virus TaxID=2600332 RepID=A0A5B8XBX8_9ORTO|nr:nucleocapsid [Lestrade virus]